MLKRFLFLAILSLSLSPFARADGALNAVEAGALAGVGGVVGCAAGATIGTLITKAQRGNSLNEISNRGRLCVAGMAVVSVGVAVAAADAEEAPQTPAEADLAGTETQE